MAVHVLKPFFNRFKVSGDTRCCTLCEKNAPKSSLYTLCLRCEKRLLMKPPSPVLNFCNRPVYAGYSLSHPLKYWLYGMKFRNQPHYATPLSELLIHYWQHVSKPNLPQHTLVLPIPPHEKEPQAALSLIAQPFVSEYGYNYLDKGLMWTRAISPQHVILSKRKRRENTFQSMHVSPLLQEKIQKAPFILIIDDILTTGATVIEALRAVQAIKPEGQVMALALAHVPLALSRQID